MHLVVRSVDVFVVTLYGLLLALWVYKGGRYYLESEGGDGYLIWILRSSKIIHLLAMVNCGSDSSPVKRQLHIPIQPQNEQYEYQLKLGTVGMRIRQSVDQGYKLPSNAQNSLIQGKQQHEFSNACIQDNSTVTIPEYKRVPLPSACPAPMLVNQRTASSSASSLEVWEDSLDQRLNMIDGDIMRNKLGSGDLDLMFANGQKRNWEQADF